MATDAIPAPEAPAAAPAAPEPAPQPEAPQGPDLSTEAGRLAAAIEAAGGPPEPTPEPPAPEPTPEDPPAEDPKAEDPPAEPEPNALPKLSELRAAVAKRQADKEAPEPAPEPPAPEPPKQAAPSILMEDLNKDAVAALRNQGVDVRSFVRQMATRVLGAGDDKEVEGKDTPKYLTAEEARAVAEERTRELLAEHQRVLQQQQEQANKQSAEQKFADASADGERYPFLSRFDPGDRVRFGYQAIQLLVSAGHSNPTDDQIAQAIENDLAERFGPVGSPGPAAITDSAPGAETAAQAPTGPKTLSQSLPAQPSSSGEPLTEEQRVEAAIRAMEAGG